VVNTIDQLTKAGVNIYIQNIQLSTLDSECQPNAIAKMITAVLSSFAEIERDGIVYRLQSGRRVAIEQRNVKLGRKVGSVKSMEQKQQEYAKVIRCLKAGKSIRDTAKICGVSVSTCQRVKKDFGL
jgi:DNA invertase Pin-like site-specific DNA recombinase